MARSFIEARIFAEFVERCKASVPVDRIRAVVEHFADAQLARVDAEGQQSSPTRGELLERDVVLSFDGW